MDKNAIKKFAVWARRELISRVSQKALQFGIAAGAAEPADATSINGKVLSTAEVQQRRALLKQVQSKGYEQVMEEVAYTWFNRFCALRFMEVNQYLPSRVRVFTNEEDAFKPQMIDEALSLELEGLSMEEVYAYKEANDKEGLFKYLLITQCNALSPILPQMFQHIADYTELLFPDNLLREGSVIHEMVTSIPTEDWKDAVQIIGWLYQYYNSEKKDEVFANLKKNVKITKDNIPAATQLFTPDWIVRYMVENSLGRLWVEGHPNEELKQQWRYFLEEAEQEPEVQAQLADIRKEYAAMKPEDIKCIDPCCGSGHILAYMFDVLVQIYESCGYTTRDAVRCIVEKNIYGLDIDDRAAQLAYFAVMMKARQYDRRFLTRKDDDDNPEVPQPKVYAICESNSIDEQSLEYFANGDAGMYFSLQTITRELHDAKEYGSLLKCSCLDYSELYARATEISTCADLYGATLVQELLPLIQVADILSRKYNSVVSNPPYMASSGMQKMLSNLVKKNYKEGHNDLYTAFILRCADFCDTHGYLGMITQLGWMSLSRSACLRESVYSKMTYSSVLYLGSHVFEEISGEVVKSGAFILSNNHLADYKSTYVKLDDVNNKIEELYNPNRTYFSKVSEDMAIEGAPLSFWLPRQMLKLFKSDSIGEYFICRAGMQTGCNDLFLRFWHELDKGSINHFNGNKWYSYNKGGSQRKWYGNLDIVVNWENDGEDIKEYKQQRLLRGEIEKKNSECWNSEFYFVEGVTWSSISSGTPMFRYTSDSSIFDIKGPTCFAKEGQSHANLMQILGYLNSTVVKSLLAVLSPTLDCNPGTVSKLPCILNQSHEQVVAYVCGCMKLSKEDWDSFETSWDFNKHPSMRGLSSVKESYEAWEREASERFYQLKANEEELNRIFIDIYGLQDELTPEVEEKDVTVRKADLGRDIRSLISYAVGCMFGRYSLDVEGLAYAGGEWDASKYSSFPADVDNIIPICDDDYFEDDIVGRFVEFIRVAYGADSLEENLRFIADALGGKGNAREVIRKYFRDDFYADHLKIYQKRPIYWQFDSGKKGGFRALVYMHRYAPDTIARIRTDYVHQQQDRYRTALEGIEQRMANAGTGERVKLSKVQKKLQEQDKELHEYEEKIHHLADRFISIDLDDGVKKNYALFADVLTKIK